uniref:Cytochrome c oxidase subunit 3 n=1 Tax=Daucus carota subsp. sativus TaxID=79200 RepID=A0A175YFB6_DAUCS
MERILTFIAISALLPVHHYIEVTTYRRSPTPPSVINSLLGDAQTIDYTEPVVPYEPVRPIDCLLDQALFANSLALSSKVLAEARRWLTGPDPLHVCGTDPSPWPISGSLGALATTVGGVMYMHPFQGGATLLSLGLIFLLYTMFVWWRDVLRESTLEGHHTKVVQLGPRYGFILFIVSEVMFLFALFWASSHSSLAPTVEIGGIWPPKGIGVLDPREIPFLNTLILPSSGAAVTWAHHAILAGKEKRAVYALVATVSLALVFTGFQGMEYYQAPSTISDSIYGSSLCMNKY